MRAIFVEHDITAQCECIRLGLDAGKTSLALLQWNSVLAVTYPARNLYHIKRGDSWEAVRQKSNQQCQAVHVALLQRSSQNTDGMDNAKGGGQVAVPPAAAAADTKPLSLHQEYDQIFKASDEQKQAWRRQDLGVRRYSTQGKACIERYRIASARILETVSMWIQESNLASIKLERASIDEFFLDVTDAVAGDAAVWKGDEFRQELQKTQRATVIVGAKSKSNRDTEPSTEEEETWPRSEYGKNEDDHLTFWKAAMIAIWIRERIRDSLGFTLSAGVGANKTLAKLSASYGKPNGQAVTFPHYVDYLLDNTKIAKCRHLGGKLGNRVTALLPNGVDPTVGNIRRHLSLTELQTGLQNKLSESAAWVFRLARGMDDEEVTTHNNETTEGSGLTKSITAFKAFPTGRKKGLTLAEASDWIKLLAEEVVGRVERDRQRNRRYPKSCSVHYALPGWSSTTSRTVRINFPAEGAPVPNKVAELCQKAPIAVAKKEGGNSAEPLRLGRFGLCATEFIARESGQQAMDAFLGKAAALSNSPRSSHHRQGSTVEKTVASPTWKQKPAKRSGQPAADLDLALAKKLQAEYDRENNAWQHLDKRRKIKKTTGLAGTTKKISSFFGKR